MSLGLTRELHNEEYSLLDGAVIAFVHLQEKSGKIVTTNDIIKFLMEGGLSLEDADDSLNFYNKSVNMGYLIHSINSQGEITISLVPSEKENATIANVND